MNVRNLTTEELIIELESYRPNFNRDDLMDEAIARLRRQSSRDRYDSLLIEILEDAQLAQDPDILRGEIRRAEQIYRLEDFLQDDLWYNWDALNREGMSMTDSDRARRIEEAAEHGLEGSTHGEIIEDWQHAVEDLRKEGEIGPFTAWALKVDIDNCYQWHRRNGSLDQQGG